MKKLTIVVLLACAALPAQVHDTDIATATRIFKVRTASPEAGGCPRHATTQPPSMETPVFVSLYLHPLPQNIIIN